MVKYKNSICVSHRDVKTSEPVCIVCMMNEIEALNVVKENYATLAAAARRLVEAVRWKQHVSNFRWDIDYSSEDIELTEEAEFEIYETGRVSMREYAAALAEVEALLSETPPRTNEDGAG